MLSIILVKKNYFGGSVYVSWVSVNHNNSFTEGPPAVSVLSQQYTDHHHILFIRW